MAKVHVIAKFNLDNVGVEIDPANDDIGAVIKWLNDLRMYSYDCEQKGEKPEYFVVKYNKEEEANDEA